MTSKKRAKGEEKISATLSLADRDVENIWLRPLGGGRWEVLTIPFWAYNLSRGDVVECHPDEDGVGLFVEKVLEKSGNRTLRLVFQAKPGLKHPEAVKLLEYLRERGWLFERFEPRMLSVNLPSASAYDELVHRLEAIDAEAGVIWEDGDPNPQKNMDSSDVEEGGGAR